LAVNAVLIWESSLIGGGNDVSGIISRGMHF